MRNACDYHAVLRDTAHVTRVICERFRKYHAWGPPRADASRPHSRGELRHTHAQQTDGTSSHPQRPDECALHSARETAARAFSTAVSTLKRPAWLLHSIRAGGREGGRVELAGAVTTAIWSTGTLAAEASSSSFGCSRWCCALRWLSGSTAHPIREHQARRHIGSAVRASAGLVSESTRNGGRPTPRSTRAELAQPCPCVRRSKIIGESARGEQRQRLGWMSSFGSRSCEVLRAGSAHCATTRRGNARIETAEEGTAAVPPVRRRIANGKLVNASA